MMHLNIFLTYDLLEHVEELVLQNQGFKIFTVQGSGRISKMPSKGPVLIV